MASTTTYLSICNQVIQEAGADLASFAVDGSDFNTLGNSNSLQQKIKGWVQRAWKEIQQNSYDWEFMEEEAVVNFDPGIMFYTDGTPVSTFQSNIPVGSKLTVYNQDGTVGQQGLVIKNITDLTGTSTLVNPFGYITLDTTGGTQLTCSFQAGSQYFKTTYSRIFAQGLAFEGGSTASVQQNNTAQYTFPILCNLNYLGVNHDVALNFVVVSPGNGLTIGISFDDAAVITAIVATSGVTLTEKFSGKIVLQYTPISMVYDLFGSGVVNGLTARGIIHSWKSFNFNEETQQNDFQENIQEIDQKSFRIIDFYNPPPTGEVPLTYMPWPTFRQVYDETSTAPGIPRVISEDNTGRWRLFPHPYYTFTLKFDFDRTAQIVSAFGDIFRIDDQFTDYILWKALIYYGTYDEQPSVAQRARENQWNVQQRFELKYRPKFVLTPHRMW